MSPPASPARRYRVFLSYSHRDTTWARWLMRRLEAYRVSRRFRGRIAPIGEVGARIAPVFRDRDELPTTSDLGESIRAALRESATLVVICSPASAKSRWVQEEIVAFKRLHGERRVFAFIVSGEPKVAGAVEDCFSPALRAEVGGDGELSNRPAEVVAADARAAGDGPKLAFVRLVAGLLGVGFDELRQRELQRRNRRLTLISAGSVAGMALTLGLAIVAWRARDDAQRRQDQAEDVLAFMLGGFRDELKKAGQLELLASVGDKATGYFDTLDPRDLTDTALARQAKALTQIGDVRMQQKNARYAEAAKAFFDAYRRAAALAARHPANGEMLFERAQAEYWIGYVHRRRGNIEAAADWFTRYRDSTGILADLDAQRLEWQRERIAGLHNLAVLELDRGNLDAARAGFVAALAMNERMLGGNPADPQLKSRVADTISWLGTVADRAGNLREAAERFTAQTQILEGLVQADAPKASPQILRWKVALANAYAMQASILAVTGRLPESREPRHQAGEIIRRLVAQDPSNRIWLRTAAGLHFKESELLYAEGDLVGAARLAASARTTYEGLARTEPTDRDLADMVAGAWRLEAELRAASGRPDAIDAARQALALAPSLVAPQPAQEKTVIVHARIALAVAEIAAGLGDQAEAVRRWRSVAEVTGPFLAQSRNWRLLDPAARALAHLGDLDASRRLVDRLTRAGYQPPQPWPDSLRH